MSSPKDPPGHEPDPYFDPHEDSVEDHGAAHAPGQTEYDPVLDFEPYEDDDAGRPPRPELWERVGDVHPGLTYSLVLLVLVAFAAELLTSFGQRGDLWSTGTVQAVAVERGAALWTALRAGEWWRVLAPLFLHANALHVGANLVALVVAGGVTERVYGHARFLLLFALAGAAGSAASFAHQAAALAAGAHAVAGSIGASGAVYGVGAAVVAAALRLRGLVPPWRARALVGATLPLLLSSLASGLSHPEVDNAAHLGGAVAGLLLGFALPLSPRLTGAGEGAVARAAWGLGGFLAAVLLLGSAAIAFGLPRPL